MIAVTSTTTAESQSQPHDKTSKKGGGGKFKGCGNKDSGVSGALETSPSNPSQIEKDTEIEHISLDLGSYSGSPVVSGVFNASSASPYTEEEETEIFHALKVIASVKEKQRLSTSGGSISVQAADDRMQFFWRFLGRQGRERNLDDVEAVLKAAFTTIEFLLTERETFEAKSEDLMSRGELVKRLRNQQRIDRSRRAVKSVFDNIGNLIETYRDDARTVTRIELLKETMKDHLDRIDASLSFLDKRVGKP